MKMRSIERTLMFVQILASTGLAAAYFLPLYETAIGDVTYADEWGLFFWAIPVVAVLWIISNRWLKAALCVLSAIGAILPFILITFLATFKSTPLIGFEVARFCILVLIVSWLILCGFTLRKPRIPAPLPHQ